MNIDFKTLENYRKTAKLTQVKLAKLCNIPYNTYAKYVNWILILNESNIKVKILIKILNQYIRNEAEILETELLELKKVELEDLLI